MNTESTPAPVIDFKIMNSEDPQRLICKVLGIQPEISNATVDHHVYTIPTGFVKDELILILPSKFPLTDYKDTIHYSRHVYKVQTPRNVHEGVLIGFTYDCTDKTPFIADGINEQEAPVISLRFN